MTKDPRWMQGDEAALGDATDAEEDIWDKADDAYDALMED
jgi:hypothetical protein